MASESFLPNTQLHQRGLLIRAGRTRASSHREPKPITGVSNASRNGGDDDERARASASRGNALQPLEDRSVGLV